MRGWKFNLPGNEMRQDSFNLLASGNVAFVIVVCASYASAGAALIRQHRAVPASEIVALAAAGALYLGIGTYGFAFFRRSESRIARPGYFIVQLSLAAALILLRGSAGELSLILLPLAGQSALILSTRLMIPVCALIYVTLVMPLLLSNRWVDAIALAIVYGVGIVFVVVFTRVAASEHEARTELAEANRQLREHAAQVEELATTKERNRLAREIHDSLGHYLTVVNVQIGAAKAVFAQDPERALSHLEKAQTLTHEGLNEVRRSVAALRSTRIDGLPLPAALAKLVKHWNSAGMNAQFEVLGAARSLEPQSEVTLYRATQEALTNAGKHAQATQVKVTVDYNGVDSIRLTVEDDGVGTTNAAGGFGLLGVRERVQLLGGELQVRSEAGKGFVLEVELPA